MKKKWTHKKHGKNWTGSYYKKKNGERNFVLKKAGKKDWDYNSHQSAKRDNWVAE